MTDDIGRTRPEWVDWLALVGVAAMVVIAATAGLLFWTRPDVVDETTAAQASRASEAAPGTTVIATTRPAPTVPPATTPPSTAAPVAVATTPTEQEFKNRWDALPVAQRVNACAAVSNEGATAVASRMDAAAPGTVRVEFIVAVLNEKCGDGSATRPAVPSATAPPVSLDIDWDAGKLDLREQMCELDYNVPVCVYSKNTDSWIPAGNG